MPPLAYRFVRFLFKVSSNAFYAVEVDGLENIPPDGCPTIFCPNHSNSLTDPILLLSTVPPEKRDMIRMTAKDTLWQKTDFFSLLIRGVGTIPIKRSKDYNNTRVDNTAAIETLVETVEKGSCVCLFPEGISRYHSQIASFKPGVALIASEILTRNKDKENFSVNLLTVSLVYNHREKFRSNVLVKFNPPIVLTPKHQNLLKTITEDGRKRSSEQAINELTNAMEDIIRSNTLDSPDWKTLRIAHTARKLYAGELGTRISFSEYIKLTKKFIDLLAKVRAIEDGNAEGSGDNDNVPNATNPLDEKEFIVERVDAGNLLTVDNPETPNDKISHQGIDLATLASDLTVYQDRLDSLGIKDYRFSQPIPLSKSALIFRIYLRVIWASFLASISIPGWILWSPVFIAVKYKEHQIRQLPTEDNFDEIAQYKLLISAILLVPIYLIACFFTLPFILITSWLIPLLMWLTIRWTEDLFQSMRSCISLTKLLFLSPSGYSNIRIMRENIRARVQVLAVHDLGLPENPEDLIGKARPRGMGYFSIRRRRKKDYNEVLRLWDVSAFE